MRTLNTFSLQTSVTQQVNDICCVTDKKTSVKVAKDVDLPQVDLPLILRLFVPGESQRMENIIGKEF